MANGNVAEVTFRQSAIYFLNFADCQKSNSLYSTLNTIYHTFRKVWLKLDENYGRSSLLKILTSEILQSALNDPKLNSKNQTQSVLHTQFLERQGLNFHVSLSIFSHIQDIAHFRIFPLTPMLTFHVPNNF